MNAQDDAFADQVYIDIDVECRECGASFDGLELAKHTEKDIRQWANEIAEVARKAGWKMDSDGNICCPNCCKIIV